MEPIAKHIHNTLIKKRLTVAIAESCTAGLACSLLAELSGSSKFLLLGVVAYSNIAKEKILGVPAALISKNGAVSKKVAARMAENIRQIAGADVGIGITGIAGPTGGTKEKPVGTVCIAVAAKYKDICQTFAFKGSRSAIRRKSALKSLELLNKLIGR